MTDKLQPPVVPERIWLSRFWANYHEHNCQFCYQQQQQDDIEYARVQNENATTLDEQLPDRIWVNPTAGVIANHQVGEAFHPYVRELSVDEGRVEEVAFTLDEIKQGYAELDRNVECMTCARLLAYVKDLLNLLPQLSSSEPDLTQHVRRVLLNCSKWGDSVCLCDDDQPEGTHDDECQDAQRLWNRVSSSEPLLPEGDGAKINPDAVLNMVWANESSVAVYVFKAANPRGAEDERRLIQIRNRETVLASATIERHNRDNLAESIGTSDLRYSAEETSKLVEAAIKRSRSSPVRLCVKCDRLFRYPPTDNKPDVTVCGDCAATGVGEGEGQEDVLWRLANDIAGAVWEKRVYLRGAHKFPAVAIGEMARIIEPFLISPVPVAKGEPDFWCPTCQVGVKSSYDDESETLMCPTCSHVYPVPPGFGTPTAAPVVDAHPIEVIIEQWRNTLQVESHITDEDAEDLLFRLIAKRGVPPSTVTNSEVAAAEIADKWFADDLPDEARVQSLKLLQLKWLAQTVISRHFFYWDRTCKVLNENIIRLRAELTAARASAIGEAIRELRRWADHIQTTAFHIGDADRAAELHAESRSVLNAVPRLGSLIQQGEDRG